MFCVLVVNNNNEIKKGKIHDVTHKTINSTVWIHLQFACMLWRKKCTQNQSDREKEREPKRTSHTDITLEWISGHSVADGLIEVCVWESVRVSVREPRGIGDDKRRTTEAHTCSHWGRTQICRTSCRLSVHARNRPEMFANGCACNELKSESKQSSSFSFFFWLPFVHASHRFNSHLQSPTNQYDVGRWQNLCGVCARRYHLMVSSNRMPNIVFLFCIANEKFVKAESVVDANTRASTCNQAFSRCECVALVMRCVT